MTKEEMNSTSPEEYAGTGGGLPNITNTPKTR